MVLKDELLAKPSRLASSNRNATGVLRACVATSFCKIPEAHWEMGLPSAITMHFVMPITYAHKPSASWVHDAVMRGWLDCSDTHDEPGKVWSLRPFDWQPHQSDAHLDSEVLVVLADLARLSRGKPSRRMLPPCTQFSVPLNVAGRLKPSELREDGELPARFLAGLPDTGMRRHGLKMLWDGSYRENTTPKPISLDEVVRTLSALSAIVLGGGGDASGSAADATSSSESHVQRALFYLQQQKVARRRILTLPNAKGAARRRKSDKDSAAFSASVWQHGRTALQFASFLVEEPAMEAMLDGLPDQYRQRMLDHQKSQLAQLPAEFVDLVLKEDKEEL